MIVVTSTAKNAPAAARRCVTSVATQPRDVKLLHLFTAADTATREAAEGEAGLYLRSGVFPARAMIYQHDCPSLENLWRMWKGLPAEDVVVWLDGDDELTAGALSRVAHFYERPDVWLTYGSFVRQDGMLDHQWAPQFGRRYPPGGARSGRWRASHLRTFRAGLLQHLQPSDLQDRSGRWFEYSTDLAVMIPLLELAGENYLVSSDVLCRYNFNAPAHGERHQQEKAVRDELVTRSPREALRVRPW